MFGRSRLVALVVLLLGNPTAGHCARDDVLIVVNDNSRDSPQVGLHYAQQRDIDPANIVHVRVPAGNFIGWDDFRRLRDQLIGFMQHNTLDDPSLAPVVCVDGDPPYYCPPAVEQLRAHTRIRYLVTTRGVPARMTVAGSTLASPTAPASVDNYLKYWLLNYFADDVPLAFGEREAAFADGRGMRPVIPRIDRELIVGRLDGLDANAARALVDRALTAERQGIYGTWYGSTKFFRWRDASTATTVYPRSDSLLSGWRYLLGMWGEERPECVAYLSFDGRLPEGKAPAHCRVQLNDDSDPAAQTTARIAYPAPGNGSAREPKVVDALGYQGWLDGQSTIGSFNALLNWRKDDQCTVTLCEDAADPALCRASSTDTFAEINTDCVGVADGFIGYNHQSYPVSYLTVWPTGWGGPADGDRDRLAFPEVRSDTGVDDSYSLWFRNADEVADPRCYASSDFTAAPDQPCTDTRRVLLQQTISPGDSLFDPGDPPSFEVTLQYRTVNLEGNVPLRARFIVRETGGSTIDYGFRTLAVLAAGDTPWTPVSVRFSLDPLLHAGNRYDRIQLVLDTQGVFSGDLGLDTIGLQRLDQGVELVTNGSFSGGHRQVSAGDHAATFLSRLNGVAFWGSVGHHQSAGCAFCFNGLEMLVYFMRGLPLGDAVWFNDSNNSGILYGDPLYSPVAVRINPVNDSDTLTGVVDLRGSTINGRDRLRVETDFRLDTCAGDDFFLCDQTQGWVATGLAGVGGVGDQSLGSWDSSSQAPGPHVLRLAVTSLDTVTGRSQTLYDYYPVTVEAAPATQAPVDATPTDSAPVEPVATPDASAPSGGGSGGCVIGPGTGGHRDFGVLAVWLLMMLTRSRRLRRLVSGLKV